MAQKLRSLRRTDAESFGSWHGTAVVIEALALLLFLAGCIAIVLSLISASYGRATAANEVSEAIVIVTNEAEQFAANPTLKAEGDTYYKKVAGVLIASETPDKDAYVLRLNKEAEQRASGILYHANFLVLYHDKELYELDTSRYVSDVSGGESDDEANGTNDGRANDTAGGASEAASGEANDEGVS